MYFVRRQRIQLSDFVPETIKLTNLTEKQKFVNEVYKGKSDSDASSPGSSLQTANNIFYSFAYRGRGVDL